MKWTVNTAQTTPHLKNWTENLGATVDYYFNASYKDGFMRSIYVRWGDDNCDRETGWRQFDVQGDKPAKRESLVYRGIIATNA